MAPGSLPPRKKVTINSLRTMHANKVPIAMMTAHDFPSGLAADQAHMDMILVGDSLAMVALGMEVRVVMVHHSGLFRPLFVTRTPHPHKTHTR